MEGKKKLLDEKKHKATTVILNIIGVIFILIGIIAGIYMNIDSKEGSKLSIEEVEAELIKEETRLKTLLTELKIETREVRAKIEENVFNKIKKEELEDSISEELETIKDIDSYFLSPAFAKGNETKKAQDLSDQLGAMKAEKHLVGGFDKTNKTGNIIRTIVVVMFPMTIAIMFFMVANRSSIAAYHAQSVVPVYKEVAEDVAPTAGKVVEEVVKGVKKGLEDEETKNKE